MARLRVSLVDVDKERKTKEVALEKGGCDTLQLGKGSGYEFEQFVELSVDDEGSVIVLYWSSDGTRIKREHGC